MTDSAIIPIAPDATAHVPAGRVPAAAPAIWALIPCAGSGSRAASLVPKQYLAIAGQAMVLHTLAAFAAVPRVARTLVVVAAGDAFFEALDGAPAQPWSWVCAGGATRALTVMNGLSALLGQGARADDWVLVHDAARCLVTSELIDRLIDACIDDPVGGLLAHPVPDTLKLAASGRVAGTTDRSHHWLAQTPQMFRIGALHGALQAAGTQVTDESSALEAIGLAPKLVPGSASNFKVTYADDFVLARAVLLGRGRMPGKELDYDYP